MEMYGFLKMLSLSSEFEDWVGKSKVCGRDDCHIIIVHQKNDNNEQTGFLINTLYNNGTQAKQIYFLGQSIYSRKVMNIDMTADTDPAYFDGNGLSTSSGSWQTDLHYQLEVNNGILSLNDYNGKTIDSVTLPTTDTSSLESSVSTLESTVSDHETRIDTLEGTNTTTMNKITSLDSSYSTLKQSVNSLSENMSELNSSVSSLDSSVSTNTTNISTNTTNISALQDSVDSAKETVTQKAISTDAGLDIPLLAAGSSSTDTELNSTQKTNGVYYSSNFDTTAYGLKVKSDSDQTTITPGLVEVRNSNTNIVIDSDSIKISDNTLSTDESISTSVSQKEIAFRSSNDSNAIMGFVLAADFGDSTIGGLVLSNSSDEYLNAMPEGLQIVSNDNKNIGVITPNTLGIQQGEDSSGLGQTGILGKVGNDYATVVAYNNNYNGGAISTLIGAESIEITDSSSGKTTTTFKVSNGTVTATNFEGLASKATADADGNVITETYAKSEDLTSLQQAYEKDLTTNIAALEETVNTTNTNVSTLQNTVSSLSSTVTIDTREVDVYMGGLVADLGTFDAASTAESFIARADICGVYTMVTFKMQNDNNTKTAVVFNTLYNSGQSAYQKYTLGQNEYYRHISNIDLENPTETTVDSWTTISYSA